MDWNSFLNKGLLRSVLCLLLAAAIVLSLVLPGMDLEAAHPQNPLEDESIREINVLSVGEEITQINTIVMPSGGSAAPTEPRESETEEENPEETKPEETVPEETQTEEQDVGDGEEGNDDGRQGSDGGQEMELQLAAVMTWYKYGNDPMNIVCSPGNAVAKTLNTAQLRDNELDYEFSLEGEDADDVDITYVTMTAGDTARQPIRERGKVDIQLPGGVGQRNYTFQVTALAKRENEDGEEIEQELTFCFVLRCEYTLDLELNLSWTDREGQERTVTCGPDKASAFSVNNYDLNERQFSYTMELDGALAEDAQILSASYTTKSGYRSGELGLEEGTMTLEPEPGVDSDIYYLTFNVRLPDRTVVYTYNLHYQESLDAKLLMHWEERGMIGHTMECRPGESVENPVRNNQLTAGAISYAFEFQGDDTEGAKFESISFVSDGESGTMQESGILPMKMPEGLGSNTYRITVGALVKGQRMNFQYVLHYSNDVTLEMTYTVLEDGAEVQRLVTCENEKSRTAENIYTDQLPDGGIQYEMTLTGADAEFVTIKTVTCYQSGSGRSITLGTSDTLIPMLGENDRPGENTFTVIAEDENKNEYKFSVNIPFKNRGGNKIRIETNLQDGQTIPNAIKTNLTVKAAILDDAGNVTGYVSPEDTEAGITVTLDGEELISVSGSATTTEYDLIPENPEEGDTNTHELYIYAEDACGNYGELRLTLNGERRDPGTKIGEATIMVDLTVLGLGVVKTLPYDVLANEPISYVIAKSLLGEDLGEPFGKAKTTLAWDGYYEGTLDEGFYLASLTTGHSVNSNMAESAWPSDDPEADLEVFDQWYGPGSGLATLWRCLRRNGLNKSSGTNGTFSEFDFTSGSGWMYSVGGTTYYPNQSMSAVYLQPGDVLTVRYTLASGWDVGSGDPGYSATIGYCVCAANGAFTINHRMETYKDEDGNEYKACYYCGMIQTCMHTNQKYVDQKDGTHVLHCDDCNTNIGEWEAHTWMDPALDDGISKDHTCERCHSTAEHRWDNNGEDTATCEEDGTWDAVCKDCEVERSLFSPAKGHDYHQTSLYDDMGHYIECFTCGYTETADHQYVYYPSIGDFVCQICYAQHNTEVCYDSMPYAELCEDVKFLCDACGYSLIRPAEIPHSYDDFGECENCSGFDPNFTATE